MPEPQTLPDLLHGWHDRPFQPFREGVEILPIREESPAVALLRYAPGSSVPAHVHTGLETILVLEGAQSDERGTYPAGTLVLNPEGSRHSVWSDTGCVVLIQWERPVRFVAETRQEVSA
ncbi:MAG: cupin domain-containing protein [Paracoccaceae bacterium]|nr:cupin domain-containing protein [Paracoccaceae bacterium]MDE3120875.1 cupin domain-containing protein [Paracoccaceae bacterium]MDE3240320.1 cupin domain-containing protein [Paracoccaceae bacterium]